jgi:hypothetical protein
MKEEVEKMRILALLVIILGIATLVFGIIFLPQASSGEKEIADSIAPLKLSEVNAKYDAVAAKYNQFKAAEEPKIQAGQAEASATYNYLSAQRALLGLAKANIAMAKVVRTMGIVNIIIGVGLVFGGCALWRKNRSVA